MNNVNRETTSFFLSKGQLKTFLNATLYSYSSERHNGIDDVYLNYSAKIQKILNKNITISQMLTDIDKFVDKITEKTNNTEFKYNQNRIKLFLKEEFLSSVSFYIHICERSHSHVYAHKFKLKLNNT